MTAEPKADPRERTREDARRDVRLGVPRTLALFEAALPQITRPAERTATYSNIARSAAALGQKNLYAQAEAEVLREIDHPTEYTAAALVELAYAANTLRSHRKARAWADEALRIARERDNAVGRASAERAVADMNTERGPDEVRKPAPELERFVQRFIDRLQRKSSPTTSTQDEEA